LTGPVQVARDVVSRRPVRHIHLDLGHPEPLAQQVNRHPGFDTEPGRQRKGSSERLAGQAALAVERLGRLPAGGAADTVAGSADHDAVSAELDPVAEDRDRHVGGAVGYR
jgi:hypothetical protein